MNESGDSEEKENSRKKKSVTETNKIADECSLCS